MSGSSKRGGCSAGEGEPGAEGCSKSRPGQRSPLRGSVTHSLGAQKRLIVARLANRRVSWWGGFEAKSAGQRQDQQRARPGANTLTLSLQQGSGRPEINWGPPASLLTAFSHVVSLFRRSLIKDYAAAQYQSWPWRLAAKIHLGEKALQNLYTVFRALVAMTVDASKDSVVLNIIWSEHLYVIDSIGFRFSHFQAFIKKASTLSGRR